MKTHCVVLIGALTIVGLWAGAGQALPPFKTAFDDRYVKNSNNAALQAAFEKTLCYTCHVKGKGKEIRNPYGEALSKVIGGNAKKRLDAAKKMGPAAALAEMKKILAQLDAAFTKVEAQKSPAGPTYGAKIKAGQLP